MFVFYYSSGGGSSGGTNTWPPDEEVHDTETWYEHGVLHTGTLGLSFPTAAQIAERVWDEDMADHTTAGTFGFFVQKLLTFAKFLGTK